VFPLIFRLTIGSLEIMLHHVNGDDSERESSNAIGMDSECQNWAIWRKGHGDRTGAAERFLLL